MTAEGVPHRLFTLGARAPGSRDPALFLWGTVQRGGERRTDFTARTTMGRSWVRVDDDGHQYGGPTLIQGDARVDGRVSVGTGGRGIVRAELVQAGRVGENVAGRGETEGELDMATYASCCGIDDGGRYLPSRRCHQHFRQRMSDQSRHGDTRTLRRQPTQSLVDFSQICVDES